MGRRSKPRSRIFYFHNFRFFLTIFVFPHYLLVIIFFLCRSKSKVPEEKRRNIRRLIAQFLQFFRPGTVQPFTIWVNKCCDIHSRYTETKMQAWILWKRCDRQSLVNCSTIHSRQNTENAPTLAIYILFVKPGWQKLCKGTKERKSFDFGKNFKH